MNEELEGFALEVINEIENVASRIKALCIKAKQRIDEKHGVNVREVAFTCLLRWEKTSGSRLGPFELTSKENNHNSAAWIHAYGILRRNNADINHPFHDKGFEWCYWLYTEKSNIIYRKKLSVQS